MTLRPSISTRTATLFPYTPLFRSDIAPLPRPHATASQSGVCHVDHGQRRLPLRPRPFRGRSSLGRCRSAGLQLLDLRDDRLSAPDRVRKRLPADGWRSEEHTSELQSLMRISYAVFCLKKKTYNIKNKQN